MEKQKGRVRKNANEQVNCAGCGMRAPKEMMTARGAEFYCQACCDVKV